MIISRGLLSSLCIVSSAADLLNENPVFNASLDGNVRRAIDIHEGDEIDEKAFKSLVRATAVLNES